MDSLDHGIVPATGGEHVQPAVGVGLEELVADGRAQAIIAAAVSVLTLVGTLVAQYLGFRATQQGHRENA